MARCCKAKPVVSIGGNRFCKRHFLAYYERKVSKVLKKASHKKLIVGLSGGKDSTAALLAIKKLSGLYDVSVEGVFIDLGIKGNSDVALKLVSKLCKDLGVKLNLFELKKEYGFTIDELAGVKLRRPVCSACGLIKRYILNRLGVELGADFVVTGHNMDDEVAFILLNLGAQNLEQLSRLGPITNSNPELKLVGRLKVLYYCSEAENKAYCELNKVEYYSSVCPYSLGGSQNRMKEKLNGIEKEFQGFKNGILKSFVKIVPGLERFNRVEDVKLCTACNYPTTGEVCAFCKLVDRVKNEKEDKAR
ncbi:TIGR00269 family protein [Candidatus Woesearchaeota archaeon]|nr:MAG: TIGR00269 family protein [Candidatus Woesearchaeota archaeon]